MAARVTRFVGVGAETNRAPHAVACDTAGVAAESCASSRHLPQVVAPLPRSPGADLTADLVDDERTRAACRPRGSRAPSASRRALGDCPHREATAPRSSATASAADAIRAVFRSAIGPHTRRPTSSARIRRNHVCVRISGAWAAEILTQTMRDGADRPSMDSGLARRVFSCAARPIIGSLPSRNAPSPPL